MLREKALYIHSYRCFIRRDVLLVVSPVEGEDKLIMFYKRVLLLMITLLLFSSCTASENQQTQPALHPGATLPITATSAAVTSPQPTPTPRPGPLPQNCPVSNPARHTISPNISSVIGTSPVWAAWIPGPNIFHLIPPPNSPYPSTYEAPYGWDLTKVVWEVGPDYHEFVTIRGYAVSDHTPLLFQFTNATPTANAVLDPQHPDHPVSDLGPNWAEWGSDIIVPKAGCYVMEVSWPVGHWDLTFAVGA